MTGKREYLVTGTIRVVDYDGFDETADLISPGTIIASTPQLAAEHAIEWWAAYGLAPQDVARGFGFRHRAKMLLRRRRPS